jgi:hypothetical protein
LKIITFPITIITLGLFLLVINAAMILLASRLVTGFHVTGWIPASLGRRGPGPGWHRSPCGLKEDINIARDLRN